MTLTQITKIRGAGIHTTSNIVSHNINSSGIITATAFKGPFTGSSNIQSGIVTATKIDLNGDIDVDGHTNLDNVNVAGVATFASAVNTGALTATTGTFSGNVSIGGTLTYEDVTNIDSVGIITARDGLKVLAGGANVVGVVTATSFSGTASGNPTLANGANNRIVTATGANALTGETNLIYDGTTLSATGAVSLAGPLVLQPGGTAWSTTNNRPQIKREADGELRLGAGSDSASNVTLYTAPSAGGTLAERLRITSAGKVGINSTSPTYALEVDGGTQNTVIVARSSDTRSQISFLDNATTGYGHVAVGCEGNDLFIRTGSGSKALTIDSSGRVIIGDVDNANAHANADDLIIGNTGNDERSGITIVSDTDKDGAIHFSDGTGAGQLRGQIVYGHTWGSFNDVMVLYTAGSKSLHIQDDGDVILGEIGATTYTESSTEAQLRVVGDAANSRPGALSLFGFGNTTNSPHARINFQQQTSGTNGQTTARIEAISVGGAEDASDLLFYTEASGESLTEKLRISSDGKIHTGDPASLATDDFNITATATGATLSLNRAKTGNASDGDLLGSIAFQSYPAGQPYTSAEAAIRAYAETGQSGSAAPTDLRFYTKPSSSGPGNSPSERLRIKSDGKVLVGSGCTDASVFNVKGQAGFADDGTNAGIIISTDDANGAAIHCLTTGGFVNGAYGNMRFNALSHKFTYGNTTRLEINSSGKAIFANEIETPQDYPVIKPTLDLNFAATKALDPRIEYYRYGPGSYIDGNGKVVLVGEDVPRFDHDPDTGECKGLLVEGERRNYFPNGVRPGDKFNHSKAGTFTENTTETTAPDGSYTATKWTFTNNDPYLYHQQTLNAGVTYTMSMWVKAGTNMAGDWLQFRIGGAPYSAQADSIIPADGTWRRITHTRTIGGSNETNANIGFEPQTSPSGNPASGDVIYIWGAQLESGSTASSFIPTYGYTQARGPDVVQITGEEFSDFYNQIEGTIFLSASYDTDARAASIVTIDDTSAYANYTEVGYRSGGASSGNLASYIRTTAGNDQYYKNWVSSATQGNEFKIALGYKDDNYASSANGSTVHTDTSGTTHKTYDRLKFSEVHTVGHGGVGHYRRLMYYPKRIPNSQLKTLTS